MKSKWEVHKKRILELAEQNDYKPYAVLRLLSEELKVSQGNALRNYIAYLLNSSSKKPKLKVSSSSKTSSNNYNRPFVLSAWSNKGYMMDVDEYCDHYKLPRHDITSYKLVSHTGTPFYNIVFKTKEEFVEDLTEEYIDSAIKKYIKPRKPLLISGRDAKFTLRVVITDCHIGMETDASGFGLYGGVWNRDELFKRGAKIIQEVSELSLLYGSFLEIHLIDLGDYMDGWDGMTVRKGHDLPQNMDNQKAFDVGMEFKIYLIESLLNLGATQHLKIHNITNDNHSGSFGYVVNSAVKKISELMYQDHVEVFNYRQFINHYIHGKHCFVLTHGKDEKNLKFGFKPILDKPAIDKINEYIEVNELHGYWITFEKGDSHQQLFDQTTSDKFNYNNYMALSPASEWVQTNYKRGRSGFSIMILDKNRKEITHTPFEFEWQKVEKAS